MHQRVLITGITGFVGSHVADRLLRDGHEVHGLARGISRDTSPPRDLPLHIADVGDAEVVARVLADVRPDVVLHFAEPLPVAGIAASALREQPARANAALGRAMESATPVAFLYCSSAAVYGSPRSLPVDEGAPLSPVTPYGDGKVRAEAEAGRHASSGNATVIIRPGNLVGPRQPSGLAVSDFARQIVEIESSRRPPVLRHGRLDIERDFLDVRDLAAACASILPAMRPGLQVFNVGSGRAVALSEVLRLLCAGAHREIRPELEQARVRIGEVQSIALDTTRVRQATGWTPAIPLERSLIDALDHWRSQANKGAGNS